MNPRSEIENTLYRYAFAYDMQGAEGIGACFTEHAEVVFSTELKVGRAAVVAELERRRGRYPEGAIPWHVITNVFIREQREREAVVASFFTFVLQSPGGEPALTSIGWYDDVFVDDGDAWRVSRRRVLGAGVP
jgi:hypothetical protein